MDEHPIRHEGAELRLHAALPPDAVAHLNQLLQAGRKVKLEKPDAVQREKVSAITEDQLREALELAEGWLAEVEAGFVAREEQLKRTPPPADVERQQVAAAEQGLRKVVQAAATAGVQFRLVVPKRNPTPA